MSTLDDIANWVQSDYLNRADLQTITRNAAVSAYTTVCAKIPFDQLMVTGPECPVVSGQTVYDLGTPVLGKLKAPTQLLPALRAIASIRMSFSPTNRRRLRRSHVRVYDSLSFTTPGQTATYARWANAIELNPPPNDNSYTLRVRYWSRPPIGQSLGDAYNIYWTDSGFGSGFSTYSTLGPKPSIGDIIQVQGVPVDYFNGIYRVSGIAGDDIQVLADNGPAPHTLGGQIFNTTFPWLTTLVTPPEWDELFRWETLYKVLHFLDQQDKAMMLVQPQPLPRQSTPKKVQMVEVGILPRLWNDLLTTVSQQENTDEDFSINPVIRAYSYRH